MLSSLPDAPCTPLLRKEGRFFLFIINRETHIGCAVSPYRREEGDPYQNRYLSGVNSSMRLFSLSVTKSTPSWSMHV